MRHLAVLLLLVIFQPAHGLDIFDDFDDGVLNPAIWYTTDDSAITESGGKLHMTQRHYLITHAEAPVGLPVRVALEATFETADQISITTRTDGVRQEVSYHRPMNGIYVTVWYNAVIAINRFVDGAHIDVARYDSSAGDIPDAGDTCVFDVRDDGTEIVVLIDGVEMLRGTDATNFPINKVSVQNSGWSGAETTLEWIEIEAPGPISTSPQSWGMTKASYR